MDIDRVKTFEQELTGAMVQTVSSHLASDAFAYGGEESITVFDTQVNTARLSYTLTPQQAQAMARELVGVYRGQIEAFAASYLNDIPDMLYTAAYTTRDELAERLRDALDGTFEEIYDNMDKIPGFTVTAHVNTQTNFVNRVVWHDFTGADAGVALTMDMLGDEGASPIGHTLFTFAGTVDGVTAEMTVEARTQRGDVISDETTVTVRNSGDSPLTSTITQYARWDKPTGAFSAGYTMETDAGFRPVDVSLLLAGTLEDTEGAVALANGTLTVESMGMEHCELALRAGIRTISEAEATVDPAEVTDFFTINQLELFGDLNTITQQLIGMLPY